MSRIVSEVLFVAGVAFVALIVFAPMGNYIMNVNRPEHFQSGQYQLEIMGVNPKVVLGGTPCLAIYVRNSGHVSIPNTTISGRYPKVCALNASLDSTFWPAAVENSTGYFLVNVSNLGYICRSGPGDELAPGATWVLYYPSLAQSGKKPFEVFLYGPGGSRAVFYYRPP